MEFHSRGGGGTGPQGPIPQKKKIQEKKPRGKSRLGRGPKFTHGELRSSYVLNSGLKLRPIMNMHCSIIRVRVFGSTFFVHFFFCW